MKKLDQKVRVSVETTKMLSANRAQNSYQKVSVETTDMLPIVSIEEIARTNTLVLANICSQNKKVVAP